MPFIIIFGSQVVVMQPTQSRDIECRRSIKRTLIVWPKFLSFLEYIFELKLPVYWECSSVSFSLCRMTLIYKRVSVSHRAAVHAPLKFSTQFFTVKLWFSYFFQTNDPDSMRLRTEKLYCGLPLMNWKRANVHIKYLGGTEKAEAWKCY